MISKDMLMIILFRAKGTSTNLMKVGSKRRRTKGEMEEQRDFERLREREIEEKLRELEELKERMRELERKDRR